MESKKVIELYLNDYAGHDDIKVKKFTDLCKRFVFGPLTERVVCLQGNGNKTEVFLFNVLPLLFESQEYAVVARDILPLDDERLKTLRYIILDHPNAEKLKQVDEYLQIMQDENYVGIKPNVTFIMQTKKSSVTLKRIKEMSGGLSNIYILNNRNLDHQFTYEIKNYRMELLEYLYNFEK